MLWCSRMLGVRTWLLLLKESQRSSVLFFSLFLVTRRKWIPSALFVTPKQTSYDSLSFSCRSHQSQLKICSYPFDDRDDGTTRRRPPTLLGFARGCHQPGKWRAAGLLNGAQGAGLGDTLRECDTQTAGRPPLPDRYHGIASVYRPRRFAGLQRDGPLLGQCLCKYTCGWICWT